MVILDTDHISLLEWTTSPPALRIKSFLALHPPDQVATTVITFEEQTRGWLAALANAKGMKEQIETYRRLKQRLELYCSFNILDFDETAAVQYQRLRRAKVRIGSMDLKIASIALSRQSLLLTCNFKDFAKVPDLRFTDASRERGTP